MSSFPTMDQYNDAVQHPQAAFSDPVLKSARIKTNGMGLPIALGGSFALTYTALAQDRKFAVRCFHKEAKGLEARYTGIAEGLRATGGPYFAGFEYQAAGVLVNGQRFPVLKMDWIEGDTFGSFLEDNFSDKSRIERLRTQFQELERFLRSKFIAHGDLQNGNVLVAKDLRLIDYDGVYVPSLAIGKGTELGQKHFQHPKRSAIDFGPEMDRFSFIVVDLSLRALAHSPILFSKYSNGENIILTANDFIDPGNSETFAAIKAIQPLARDADNLASICTASVKSVPTLEDFLAGKSIPAAAILIRGPGPTIKKEVLYVGAYEVIDANNYNAVARQIGNRVELVGVVTKVHSAKTRHGKPYFSVFFNSSRQAVKLNIWSEGLLKLARSPSQAWLGTWLSVQGLIDPPYSGRNGSSLSITITSNNQLRTITEVKARHRLKSVDQSPNTANPAIVERLGGKRPNGRAPAPLSPPRSQAQRSQSKSQAILTAINKGPGSSAGSRSGRASPPTKQEIPWGWIVVGGGVVLLMILGALH